MHVDPFRYASQHSIVPNMSSEPTTPPVLPSSPSRHENLVGAILWLLPLEQIPDHGRYKLKAKACGHPCVVVQDCRATEPDFVRICILASYSHSSSYNSLGKKEQYDHVPIHPNKPDGRVQPSILYLRHRQRTEMLLKKKSWVNTRRVYKVPVSVLRPYETFQSWCRYRLADTSIQALQSALLIGALDSTLEAAPSLSFSSPVLSESQSQPDGLLASPDIFWSPVQNTSPDTFSRQTIVTPSDIPIFDGPNAALSESQTQMPAAGENDSNKALSGDANTESIDKPRAPLSSKQSPFYIIFPFDAGPYPRRTAEDNDLAITSPLLPLPATADNNRSRRKLLSRSQGIVCVCGASVGVAFIIALAFAPMKAANFMYAIYLRLWI